MNALYADREGNLLDPLGGLPDLQSGLVRFIGDAKDRIREDYLRILRFFRFHAWYGRDGIDPDGLAACAELADGMESLARERVGWEFRKLLGATDPSPAMASMASAGVLARCLPGADPQALAPLVHLESASGLSPDWMVRLIAIGGEGVAARLKFSRSEQATHAAISKALGWQDRPVAEVSYRAGPDVARAAAMLVAASIGATLAEDLEAELARGAEAVFPLKARDLISAGYTPGPSLGTCLSLRESDWIASDFTLSHTELLALVDSPH